MKTNKMSIAALVLSVFPFITLLLTFLGVTLSDNLRTPMAMTNCICTFAAFILAVFLVKNREKRTRFIGTYHKRIITDRYCGYSCLCSAL